MLLEELPSEHLGEDISRVGLASDVAHDDHTSAPQLTHLEHLAVNVTRVLCGREAVAEVISKLPCCQYELR